MEPNGLGGGMFPSINTGLLGVESPLQQQQQQNLQNQQQNPHHLHHPQMVYASQSMKLGYPFSASKTNNIKPQGSTLSDEDEPGFAAEDSSAGDPKRKASPWHRMKWTDKMVRLLIMAVYYIGDEAGSEGGGGCDPAGKKKSTGFLQKKGKWKSVSRAMMEKGFYVSPQQCEDKFNDLNKRYKRVNDILGKGTACRVVENQSLLDTMDLSPKMKEEVRKLLNSKHLFFREMCAYHNSCGHGGATTTITGAQQSAEAGAGTGTATEPSIAQPQQQQHSQQRCFHSSVNGVGNMLKRRSGELEDDDDDDDDESEGSSDDEEEESGEGGSRGQVEDDENDVRSLRKRQRNNNKQVACVMMQQLNSEVAGVMQDAGRSGWEKKEWMRKRAMQLEERGVGYMVAAFELEKQRLKWARFSGKKEREMERDKLENERRRLENERMVLLLRRKELELRSVQQQQLQQHSST